MVDIKEIKRINQRLAEMEKKGLENTYDYQRMVSSIPPDYETRSRDGHIRLSRSKETLQNMDKKELEWINEKVVGIKGLQEKTGKKGQELYTELQNYTNVKDFMDNTSNLAKLYNLARQGITEAETAVTMLKNGLNNYTYDEVLPLFNAIKNDTYTEDFEVEW